MAWPVNARYVTALPGGVVSSGYGNAVQDAVIGVVGGSKSVKGITVDGVGDSGTVGAAGVARLNGDGTDDTPCRQTSAVPTTYLLVNEYAIGGGAKAREYAGNIGATFIGNLVTINARYNTGDTKWYYDVGGTATLTNQAAGSFDLYGYGGADGWLDGAWGVQDPGTPDVSFNAGGNVVMQKAMQAKIFQGTGSSPTIAVGAAAGVGTGAAVLAGTNTSGLIRLTLAGVSGLGVYATVTFANGGYNAKPNGIILTPSNARAAGLGAAQFYVDPSTATATTFDIYAVSPTTGFAYDLSYTVIA